MSFRPWSFFCPELHGLFIATALTATGRFGVIEIERQATAAISWKQRQFDWGTSARTLAHSKLSALIRSGDLVRDGSATQNFAAD